LSSGSVRVSDPQGDTLTKGDIAPPKPLFRPQSSHRRATPQMPEPNDRSRRIGTKELMLLMLALWLLFAIVVHLFVTPLNRIIIPYLDVPLGFFIAAQGALFAFVIMAFVFSRGHDPVDRNRFVDRG
jgi:putative solute:sodium symporter small subunit